MSVKNRNMPTIKLHKQVLLKKLGKKLADEQLKDRISYLGTDLDSIEGDQINVEIFPNRPDMLSEQGFSRAFSTFMGVKPGLREYDVKPSGEKVIIDKSVKDIRPYTACAIAKNLSLSDENIKELIRIQEKLHASFCRNRKRAAIGIYPLEHITLPIYFKAMEPDQIKFRPLESPREMTGRQILSQHPAGREYGHLLEGLEKFPVFIDSAGNILSMPPIINSHITGKVTEATREVFIECSGFDFRVQSQCLNILVTTMADMGAEICSMELVYPNAKYVTPDLKPGRMVLDLHYANKILGLNLKEAEVERLLGRMGYGFQNRQALIPAYRADVLHQIDLVEDIAIAYGYENFRAEIPAISTVAEEDRFERIKRRISEILAGLGLIEVNTYHLTSREAQADRMNLKLDPVEVASSATKEYNTLRQWMIPSLMQVLYENKHHEYPQNIFDIGTVFRKNPSTETGVEENDRLAVVLCSQATDFTKIKQVMDYLFRCLDIKYTMEETDHGSFIEGRVARVSANGKKIAYIGEIHPKVLESWGIDMPVAAFELNLSEMFLK